MRFARIVFRVAGIWGFLVLTPLYFIFDRIGKQDPPPITHPGFYYGFVGVALVWQVAFLIVSSDPVRFRPLMIACVLEKFTYGATLTVLYLQQRLHASDLTFAVIDSLLGVLFLAAYVKTGNQQITSKAL